MVPRGHITVVALCTLLVIPSAHADIYRWGTGEVIAGTEEIAKGALMSNRVPAAANGFCGRTISLASHRSFQPSFTTFRMSFSDARMSPEPIQPPRPYPII